MQFVYLAALYLVLDLVWIQGMTPIFYRSAFEGIQHSPLQFQMLYALAAYAVLLGVLYYICRPLSKSEPYTKRPWLAYALVGFALYSVYNLTNAAVFTEYPQKMILIDTLWGTSAFALLGWLDTYIN